MKPYHGVCYVLQYVGVVQPLPEILEQGTRVQARLPVAYGNVVILLVPGERNLGLCGAVVQERFLLLLSVFD